MTPRFLYRDWADDTLKAIPCTTYGPDRTLPPDVPALMFVAPSGPEVAVDGVRELHAYLTRWLAIHDPTHPHRTEDEAPRS